MEHGLCYVWRSCSRYSQIFSLEERKQQETIAKMQYLWESGEPILMAMVRSMGEFPRPRVKEKISQGSKAFSVKCPTLKA